MPVLRPRFFKSGAAFERWLAENHQQAKGLLVGFFRKDSGKGGLTYPESLDAALCYGWIDGLRRRFDPSSYTIRFSPRRPRSIWSRVNIRRVGELKALGRVSAAGLTVFEARDPERSGLYSFERAEMKMDSVFEKKFRRKRKSWSFWEKQPPYYRRMLTFWVMSAKREETRIRRLALLISESAMGRRLLR